MPSIPTTSRLTLERKYTATIAKSPSFTPSRHEIRPWSRAARSMSMAWQSIRTTSSPADVSPQAAAPKTE
jgi:hypothetical protein